MSFSSQGPSINDVTLFTTKEEALSPYQRASIIHSPLFALLKHFLELKIRIDCDLIWWLITSFALNMTWHKIWNQHLSLSFSLSLTHTHTHTHRHSSSSLFFSLHTNINRNQLNVAVSRFLPNILDTSSLVMIF